MSAKWRRNKRNPKRFSIFRAFSRVKRKSVSRTFPVKQSKKGRTAYTRRYSILKINAEKGMKEPEPLIDVLEEDGEIRVVAELAGYDRENLRVHVKNQRLTLSAEASDRKYHKSLNLPKRVIPNTIRTTYKNGVLEIRLKKTVEEKPIDKLAG